MKISDRSDFFSMDSTLSSLKRPKDRTLRAQIARELREAIISGELPPDTRLIEKDLADQFQISRGPLREALRELEEEGLVETRPHVGSKVRNFSGKELADTYSLRRILERYAFEIFWDHRDQDFFDELDIRHERLLHAIRSGVPHEEDLAELEFHSLVFESTGNRPLMETWDRLSRRVAFCFAMFRPQKRTLKMKLEGHVDYVDCAKGNSLKKMLSEIDKHTSQVEPKFSEMIEMKTGNSPPET